MRGRPAGGVDIEGDGGSGVEDVVDGRGGGGGGSGLWGGSHVVNTARSEVRRPMASRRPTRIFKLGNAVFAQTNCPQNSSRRSSHPAVRYLEYRIRELMGRCLAYETWWRFRGLHMESSGRGPPESDADICLLQLPTVKYQSSRVIRCDF